MQRIDDFNSLSGRHGAFWPEQFGNKGGCLWPNHDRALEAAQVMVKRYPEHKYGVFKLFTVVEAEEKPIRITPVV